MKNSSKLVMLALFILLMSNCKPKCDASIDIYEGSRFQKGQRYSLSIENGELEKSQSFWAEMSRGTFQKLDSYCISKDSIKVQFTLDGRDTVFYVNRSKTKRLLVGSYFDGAIMVATDENPEMWTKM